MGLSASQARMLSLTSRLSDLEFSAQSISNSKIRLADSSAEASRNYQSALDKEKITVMSSDAKTYVDASAYNLTTYKAVSSTDKQRFLKDAGGKVLVTTAVGDAFDTGNINTFLTSMNVVTNPTAIGYDAGKVQYYTNVYNEIVESGGYNKPGDDNMRDSEWLYKELSSGNIYLSEWASNGGEEGTGDFVEVSWSSGDATLQTEKDKTEIARAEAEYETTLAEIEAKDSKFDLQLKQIDTEHNAIQTEMDSVKKVMDKNIERTFKIFDA